MFDAKQLLDALLSGAGQNAPAQQQAHQAGMGDILGQVLGGLQGGGQQAQGGAGGLGDLLGKVMGGAQQSGGAAAGGLGGLLGQVLGGGQQGGAGGIGGMLGQILGQATGGAGDLARKANEATGAGGKLEELIAQATGGQNSGAILEQLKNLAGNNQAATGAVIGTLGSILLGTQTGRSITASAAKLGGLALIGGLAYRAYQNYLEGKPLVEPGETPKPAPLASPFHPESGDGQANAVLCLRAMIAAAASDGVIDEEERKGILGNLEQLGASKEMVNFLKHEVANPADPQSLANEVEGPEQAAQVFTAARIAVDLDNQEEVQFLTDLAGALGLDQGLVDQIDAAARSVKA